MSPAPPSLSLALNSLLVASAVAMVVLEPSHLAAMPLSQLGGYEREAVSEVLQERELSVERTPEGKRIDQLHIANLDVFGSDTGWLQKLNFFHRTTIESTIRRELLIQRGEIWSESRARESERILRNPSLSSFVVLVPVQSDIPGHVDVLVVTRDVWSLRSNSELVHQDGQFAFLKVAAAENNILGRRKHLSAIFEMDQGEFSLSARWRDLNVLGKRWQFLFRPRVIFGRSSKDYEGTQSLTRIIYPLWSLESKWGLSFSASHKHAITRNFEGDELATFDDPQTPEVESIPQEFRQKDLAINTKVSRSFGHAFKYTFSLGHEILATRPRLLAMPGVAPASAEAFASAIFPRDERSSAATVGFDFFQARYVTYRNLNGYDLPEIKLAGPQLGVDLALALKSIGSERAFARGVLRTGYLIDFGGEALIRLEASLARRFERGADGSLDSVDSSLGFDWFAASPVLPGFLRLVALGETNLRSDVEDNQIIRLGGQEDLRGYPFGSFTGTSFFRSSVELRSLPHTIAFLRLGFVAFWDVGDAADRPGDFVAHHDVGVGLKGLFPQTGESLMFLYWAVPLDREAGGFPGRISLGFGREL